MPTRPIPTACNFLKPSALGWPPPASDSDICAKLVAMREGRKEGTVTTLALDIKVIVLLV